MEPSLSTGRAAALYVGALLGPSVLLLPGLAASLAGPASIVAWAGLLLLSAMLAGVFTALGTRFPVAGGVAAYTAAGFGERAGRAAAWCFLAGVVLGAPVVCLVGGSYVAVLAGGGRGAELGAAAAILVAVIAVTAAGARAGGAAQLVLVGVLLALVAVAVAGSAPAARGAHWAPFAPHGWGSLGSAAAVLMMSFVGWEAIAPLTPRLRGPGQLARVIGIALVVTSVVYLALAAATIGVLGPDAGSSVPLSKLLGVALGPAGPAVAAVAAVALTLATTNAYLTGAAQLARDLDAPLAGRRLQLAVGVAGLLVLGAAAAGPLDTAALVALPTALFLAVYLGCTAAAARVLRGPFRGVAVAACLAVAVILGFSGWALLLPVAVAALALRTSRSQGATSSTRPIGSNGRRVTRGRTSTAAPAAVPAVAAPSSPRCRS